MSSSPETDKIVSVVTPVHGAGAHYLPEAYESLCVQTLPNGWTWEWLVQVDGESEEVHVPDDDRVRLAHGRRGGPGVARTLALARSQGSLIKVLDADDRLMADALARDIDVLTGASAVSWTTSSAFDLMPDGSLVRHDSDPPEGVLPKGAVLDHWRSHGHRLPVHPATLCIRRDLVVALGGWMALPASEDTGLLLAASTVTPGYFIAEAGLLYRKWPGQATAQTAHLHCGERHFRQSIIEERALALDDRLTRTGPAARWASPLHQRLPRQRTTDEVATALSAPNQADESSIAADRS